MIYNWQKAWKTQAFRIASYGLEAWNGEGVEREGKSFKINIYGISKNYYLQHTEFYLQ